MSESTALSNVLYERKRQDQKWGVQNHHPAMWMLILQEEVGEAARAILEAKDECGEYKYRDELVHVAAVAIAAIECFDRAHRDLAQKEVQS